MKKILPVIFIAASFSAFAGKNNTGVPAPKPATDTTVLPQIMALPLASYIGKPVDSLLSVLPIPYTDRDFIPARAGYCRGLYQVYGDHEVNTVTVQIFVDHFQHMPFPNRTKTTNWSMTLAKLEIISYIRVVKSNTICLFGCNNPKYYD